MNNINFFILSAIQLIIVYLFFLPNLSYEQLNTKPDRSMEYVDGIRYYKYENPEIDLFFKYPINWKLFEVINHFSHKDRVISFEIQNSELDDINNSKHTKKNSGSPYSGFPSVVNIWLYESKNKNISITELTKIKIQDLKNLFNDYDFNILKNEITAPNENIRILILQYSIGPYFSGKLLKDMRLTLDILIPRGDKVYEIEYIALQEDYSKNLKDVIDFIDSIRIS